MVPQLGQQHRQHRRLRGGNAAEQRQAQPLQRGIHRTEALIIQPAPDDVAGDIRRHHRQEHRKFEERPTTREIWAVEQQRIGQREADIHHHGQQCVFQRMRQGGEEHRIGQHIVVIGQPHIGRAGPQRGGGLRERHLNAEQDRPQTEQNGQRRKRQRQTVEHSIGAQPSQDNQPFFSDRVLASARISAAVSAMNTFRSAGGRAMAPSSLR